MSIASVLASIDAEIGKLEQVRAVLNGAATTKSATAPKKRGRRKLSPEARKRIGDAQRKRWEKFYANK